MSGSLTVRVLGDDEAAYVSLAAESLIASDLNLWETYLDRIGRQNVRVIYDGTMLVGGLTMYRIGQWFGGKVLPTAAVSGVAISPTHRGSGTCETLLREMLSELYHDGTALASLYASTQRLYRKVGFRQAGSQVLHSLPLASIASTSRDLPVRRYESPPQDQLAQVANENAKQCNGHLDRSPGLWDRLIHPNSGASTRTYVIGDEAEPVGYAIFQVGDRSAGVPQPLIATDLAATTLPALNRLMMLARDHRSMCNMLQWHGGPDDPMIFLAEEQNASVLNRYHWMTRVVNVAKALAGRGYSPRVSGVLDFEILDAVLPANQGRWRLVVEQGVASVEPGGTGALQMDVQTLAPLFSSFRSATQLAQLGLLEIRDGAQGRLADLMFAGPTPWMCEIF
ncbi:GNAT family N-acetyltransferase [Stieleria varia]|uniref:Enhanced intracellular survival protein n=1 Tax=Stieleria varia TaxID=2528005 RepID=A0A5C6B8C8_9BACT|nr:GNAT family N-acetyltransferase [Stieleria varia]TWU07506.1 Enhanced intracellular survival protein [Stieleria varia]